MKVVISDTNVFIDLLNAKLLETFLYLPIAVHTTNFVINELKDEQAEVINQKAKENKIIIIEANDIEYGEIVEQVKEKETLSLVDHSVYYYAKKLRATILTGDKAFRSYVEEQKIEVRGILWIFDEISDKKLLGEQELNAKLKSLMETNKRLPIAECNKRLEIWEKAK